MDSRTSCRTRGSSDRNMDFEQLVLLSLIRLSEDAYGVPMRHELRTRGGRDVTLGSVYKTLERLEAARPAAWISQTMSDKHWFIERTQAFGNGVSVVGARIGERQSCYAAPATLG